MMLSFSVVGDLLGQNRCLLGNAVLLADEYLVSQLRVPSLYQTAGNLTKSDKSIIREIVKLLIFNSAELRDIFIAIPDIKIRVKRFFGNCFSHGDSSDESFIHAYVFLFWDDISLVLKFNRPLPSRIMWGSSEFGYTSPDMNQAELAISSKMTSYGVEIDLFASDIDTQTIALIEIKRGSIDDRAIGQILRYYQTVWQALNEREFRAMNISYVWPIILVQSITGRELQSLPVHFRGLLDVITYRIDLQGMPEFHSLRTSPSIKNYI
jgi:hypothetical protein